PLHIVVQRSVVVHEPLARLPACLLEDLHWNLDLLTFGPAGVFREFDGSALDIAVQCLGHRVAGGSYGAKHSSIRMSTRYVTGETAIGSRNGHLTGPASFRE